MDSNITQNELIELWYDMNDTHCCSCHIHPPCDHCVSGFSLPLEEFLSGHGYEANNIEPLESVVDNYNRAMKLIK